MTLGAGTPNKISHFENVSSKIIFTMLHNVCKILDFDDKSHFTIFLGGSRSERTRTRWKSSLQLTLAVFGILQSLLVAMY